MNFLKEFFCNPRGVGAIAPSSKALAELMVGTANLESKHSVVELGPGMGAFTGQILNNLALDASFFCIESNEKFVKALQEKYPDLDVCHGFAQDMKQQLENRELSHCDCVISGLPWAAFDDDLQSEILGSVYDSMDQGAVFLTFAYSFGTVLPKGKAFNRLLHKTFDTVDTTRTVWKNLPPAFVYVCKKYTTPLSKSKLLF